MAWKVKLSPSDPDEARPRPPPGWMRDMYRNAGIEAPEYLRVPSDEGMWRVQQTREAKDDLR